MSEEWRDDPQGTKHDSWIDLTYEHDEDGHWWEAGVKFDGCVHLRRAFNVPFPALRDEHVAMEDYMHLCDLDATIEMLTKLRDAAKKHFGPGWPD